MIENLEFLDNFLQDSWKEVNHYHLNPLQRSILLLHHLLPWVKHHFKSGEKYQELRNKHSELALVQRGMMTYNFEGKFYIQLKDDLLVIPVNLAHSVEIGTGEDCIVYTYYKQ